MVVPKAYVLWGKAAALANTYNINMVMFNRGARPGHRSPKFSKRVSRLTLGLRRCIFSTDGQRSPGARPRCKAQPTIPLKGVQSSTPKPSLPAAATSRA